MAQPPTVNPQLGLPMTTLLTSTPPRDATPLAPSTSGRYRVGQSSKNVAAPEQESTPTRLHVYGTPASYAARSSYTVATGAGFSFDPTHTPRAPRYAHPYDSTSSPRTAPIATYSAYPWTGLGQPGPSTSPNNMPPAPPAKIAFHQSPTRPANTGSRESAASYRLPPSGFRPPAGFHLQLPPSASTAFYGLPPSSDHNASSCEHLPHPALGPPCYCSQPGSPIQAHELLARAPLLAPDQARFRDFCPVYPPLSGQYAFVRPPQAYAPAPATSSTMPFASAPTYDLNAHRPFWNRPELQQESYERTCLPSDAPSPAANVQGPHIRPGIPLPPSADYTLHFRSFFPSSIEAAARASAQWAQAGRAELLVDNGVPHVTRNEITTVGFLIAVHAGMKKQCRETAARLKQVEELASLGPTANAKVDDLVVRLRIDQQRWEHATIQIGDTIKELPGWDEADRLATTESVSDTEDSSLAGPSEDEAQPARMRVRATDNDVAESGSSTKKRKSSKQPEKAV